MLRVWKKCLSLSMLLAGLAAPVYAEPLTGKQAQKQMFSPKGAEIVMMEHKSLTPQNIALLQQVASGYAYYAAVAIAPGEDLLKSEATMLVANHHSVEAASTAALAGCNKARKGGAECVIAAMVRPKKWQPRDLQLSVEGTVALNRDYGRTGPRAMAISETTGFFALGKGGDAQEAALAACTKKGAEDCVIVVVD